MSVTGEFQRAPSHDRLVSGMRVGWLVLAVVTVVLGVAAVTSSVGQITTCETDLYSREVPNLEACNASIGSYFGSALVPVLAVPVLVCLPPVFMPRPGAAWSGAWSGRRWCAGSDECGSRIQMPPATIPMCPSPSYAPDHYRRHRHPVLTRCNASREEARAGCASPARRSRPGLIQHPTATCLAKGPNGLNENPVKQGRAYLPGGDSTTAAACWW